MKRLLNVFALTVVAGLAACNAANNEDILTSVTAQPQTASNPQTSSQVAPAYFDSQRKSDPASGQGIVGQPLPQTTAGTWPRNRSSFASETDSLAQVAAVPRFKKTYLINGLASNIGNIGFGFKNLSKKIPGSILYNYASFVESSTVIRSRVTKELKAAYRKNPNLEINLIGISFGANIVTIIAQELHRSKIPVNYLATLDGPAMLPIRKNVRVTDNFTCTNLDCFKTNTRLGWGNKETQKQSFRLKSSHIPLANHPKVHARILQQINAKPPFKNVAVQ